MSAGTQAAPSGASAAPSWKAALSDDGGQSAEPTKGTAASTDVEHHGGEGERTPSSPPSSGGAGGAEGAQQPATKPPGTVIQMDDATMQKMLEGVVGKLGTKPPGETEPAAPTEDELNKMFNVFKVDPAALQEALGLTEAPNEKLLGFYNTLAQGAARQAVTIAEYAIALHMRQMQENISPVMKFYEEQYVRQAGERFFGRYPNMKGLEPLLTKIKDAFTVQNRKFKNEDEAFKAVAEEVVNTLKTVPGIDTSKLLESAAAGAGGEPNTQHQPASTMPALSSGGQGGSGGGSGSPSSKAPLWRRALG